MATLRDSGWQEPLSVFANILSPFSGDFKLFPTHPSNGKLKEEVDNLGGKMKAMRDLDFLLSPVGLQGFHDRENNRLRAREGGSWNESRHLQLEKEIATLDIEIWSKQQMGHFRRDLVQQRNNAELRLILLLAGIDSWRCLGGLSRAERGRSEREKISREDEWEKLFRKKWIDKEVAALRKKLPMLKRIIPEERLDGISQLGSTIRVRGRSRNVAQYTEVGAGSVRSVNKYAGGIEGIIHSSSSSMYLNDSEFPTWIVYHRRNGETVAYLLCTTQDPGIMSLDATMALENVHQQGKSYGDMQLSTLRFSANGNVISLLDPGDLDLGSRARWAPPEIDGLSIGDTLSLPLADRRNADMYGLGGTILELHVWEDGVCKPTLIPSMVDRIRHLEASTPEPSKAKAMTIVDVIQKCFATAPVDRPSASTVRRWLEKIYRVTLMIDYTKRFASRLSTVLLPFWHGSNIYR